MNNEIDNNKLIAEFINIKLNDLTSIGLDILKDTKEKIQIKLKSVYKKYLTDILVRYGNSKSFFHTEKGIPLNLFYVPLGIQSSTIIMKTANLKSILDVGSNITISGTGGAGKSILLKHLFINSIYLKKQVPVFIELRDLNKNETKLLDLIHETFITFGLKIEKLFLEKSMEKGQFIFFLDGLDEVKSSFRNDLLKEIDDLTKKYSGCSMILSTRPDLHISELTTFINFKVMPLTMSKSISLVKKLPADNKIKEKFINDLESYLFDEHQSLLSNPLLLSIMLLTYGYSADIPNKLSVFYNQAYEALFQRHDALKGAFKRNRATKLDIQQFERVLSTFSILTYEKRKFSFSRNEAIKFISQAKELTGIEFIPNNYLIDLLQSVCLLIEDGLFLSFTHRSFQEYFTAKFIDNSSTNVKKKLLEKYQSNIKDDNVYRLMYELDGDFMEFEIIIPFIENLFKRIKLNKNIGISHYLRFVKILWKKFSFRDGKLYGTINEVQVHELVYFIIFFVRENKNNFSIKPKKSNWIAKEKAKTVNEKIALTYTTKKMKTTDTITKELYNDGMLFSKEALLLLQKVYKDIKKRKKETKQKLFDLLLKEKT